MSETTIKTALITGGSSGLGLEVAKQLVKDNYHVILVARDENKLQKAAMEIRNATKSGDSSALVTVISADISKADSLQKVVEELKSRQIKINFLILNAAIVHVNTVVDSSIDALQEVVNINLWGTMLSAKLFIPYLAEKAKILFVSSTWGFIGGAGYSSYCAAKAGVNNFASSLRRELLGRADVYLACPAEIDTPQYQGEFEKMPAWMKNTGSRNKPMRADMAAARILRQCDGGKFLIFINKDAYFLFSILPRILPLRVIDWLGDKILPRPH